MGQLATGFFWTCAGLILFKFLPDNVPKKFGRLLYWVGVPLQILSLAHSSDFARAPWLPPLTVLLVLVLGLLTSILCLSGLKQARSTSIEAHRPQTILAAEAAFLITPQTPADRFSSQLIELCSRAWPQQRPSRGSFILSSMLGNTIFIGLAIIPSLVDHAYLGWIILYGVAHYLLGSYGIGVFLASHYGRNHVSNDWSTQIQDYNSPDSLECLPFSSSWGCSWGNSGACKGYKPPLCLPPLKCWCFHSLQDWAFRSLECMAMQD
jgi:malate permease and related proteins